MARSVARLLGAAWLTVLLISLPTEGQAPTPLGDEFQVNTYTSNYQFSSSVAATGDDGFVVVWTSYDDALDEYGGIFGQRYDAEGSRLGGEFHLNVETTSYQFSPALAGAGDGSFAVVWTSYEQGGEAPDIFGRRFDSQGGPAGAVFPVNEYTTSVQDGAKIEMEPDGSFLVVWRSLQAPGGPVRLRRFTSSGLSIGGELAVGSAGDAGRPAVSGPGDGSFVITWDAAGDGSQRGVRARRFDSAGLALGDEIQVNSQTADFQIQSDVAVQADGDFVIVWTSYTGDGSDHAVFGRRFDSAGVAIGADFPVNTYTTGDQRSPHIVVDFAGTMLVVWDSESQDMNGSAMVGRLWNASGEAIAEEFIVNTYTTGYQAPGAAAFTSDNHFVVVWDTYPVDGYGGEIAGQRFLYNLIFADGFESGDVSRWTLSVQ